MWRANSSRIALSRRRTIAGSDIHFFSRRNRIPISSHVCDIPFPPTVFCSHLVHLVVAQYNHDFDVIVHVGSSDYDLTNYRITRHPCLTAELICRVTVGGGCGFESTNDIIDPLPVFRSVNFQCL